MISTRRAFALLLQVSMVAIAPFAQAQGTPTPTATRNPEATRADLEVQLAADRRDSVGGSDADRARRTAEIATIQDRLTNGDFAVGDRIVLSVAGQAAL